MKINCTVTIPDELYREFLQHMRDFDMKHDPNHEGRIQCFFLADCDSMTAEEALAAMQGISPAPKHVSRIKLDS